MNKRCINFVCPVKQKGYGICLGALSNPDRVCMFKSGRETGKLTPRIDSHSSGPFLSNIHFHTLKSKQYLVKLL